MIRNRIRLTRELVLTAVGLSFILGILSGCVPAFAGEVVTPDQRDRRSSSADSTAAQEEISAARELESVQGNKFKGSGRFRGFRTHRDDEGLTDEQRRLLEQLESIGYLSGSTEAPDLVGVTIHNEDLSCSGYNFYTSGHAPEAILMDMDGNVLHRWRLDCNDVWRGHPDGIAGSKYNDTHWRRAYLYENGDILAIFEGLGIIKLDKDSNLIWAHPGREHHDLEVMPSGEVYVLTREAKVIPRLAPVRPIQEDFVSILDVDGNETARISLLECFENSDTYSPILINRRTRTGDIFHTNTLEVLDGRIEEVVPAFKAGRILTSMLNLNAIAVVDLDLKEVVWAYRGEFRKQHDPRIIDNGHLLLFNNNRGGDGQSSVLEYDPATMEIVWAYRGTAREPLYTRSCGAAQRLPNGNTLMTESDNGRAIEVTPEKEIVWEFLNPERAGEENEFIATLFEVVRLPAEFPVEWTDSIHAQ